MAAGDSFIDDKTTTQHAPLESLLTYLRTRLILKFTMDAVVLDFGCGSHLKTLRTVGARAKSRYGIDSFFKGRAAHKTHDGIFVAGSFTELAEQLKHNRENVSCIVSLACFEHLTEEALVGVLKDLYQISSDSAVLVGTVPTPPAKPVLEFLSYKLGLIDPSQIEDHKVYYNQKMLSAALADTGWKMTHYRTFQFGMNSFFKIEKRNV